MTRIADSEVGAAKSPTIATNGWVVQKFGGTSLGKFPQGVADIIKYPKLSNQTCMVIH